MTSYFKNLTIPYYSRLFLSIPFYSFAFKNIQILLIKIGTIMIFVIIIDNLNSFFSSKFYLYSKDINKNIAIIFQNSFKCTN